MADYYPVLKRAISSLPSSSGEARRAVYEKARGALLKQLQSYDPPLSPAEITEQRLALEESIRRVESEVAGAVFGLGTPAAKPAEVKPEPKPAAEVAKPEKRPEPAPPRRPEPAPEPKAEDLRPSLAERVRPEPREEAKAVPREEPKAAPAPEPKLEAPTVVTVAKPTPAPVQVSREEAAPPAPPSGEPAAEAKIGAGMSALSKTLRQAEALGGASAQALRSARDAIDGPAVDEVEPERVREGAGKIEPGFMEAPLGTRLGAPEPVVAPAPAPRPAIVRRAPARRLPVSPQLAAGLALIILVLGGAAVAGWLQRERITAWFAGEPAIEAPTPTATATPPVEEPIAAEPPADGLEPKITDRLPQDGETTQPVAPDARTVQTERVGPAETDPAVPPPPGPVATAEPTAPAAPDPVEPPAATPPAAESPPPAAEPTSPAAETPVGTPSTETPVATAPSPGTPPPTETPSAGETVLVAQKAILYEEPIPGSQGSRTEARVLWSFVNEGVLPGEPPVPQIRAVIEVPEKQLTLTLSLRRNTDAALPASHIAELKFDLAQGFAGGAIDTTPGLILKQTEDARGDPLIGAVAKVADNLFWLALSGVDQDSARNVALLREREWIDVPIRYGNRRRAILTFEKGSPGADVFRQVFAAWGG